MVLSFLAILAALLLSLGPTSILAQISTSVVCLSSFSWMDNTLNQNPCLVTAYLAGVCDDGTYTVDGLKAGFHYIGPSASIQNPCQCSSVLYNTFSACAVCQGATFINWSQWKFNCSTVYPGFFAPGIPDGTAVPHWAFQDVKTSDLFNATLAQAAGDTPESTATLAQSTSLLSATSTATSVSVTSAPQSATTPTVTPTSSGSSSNTAVIAGSVTGGVAGLLIVGLIVFKFFVKKPRASSSPSTAHKQTAPEVTPEAAYTSGRPFGIEDPPEIRDKITSPEP